MFFAPGGRAVAQTVAGVSVDLLRQFECSACPLNHKAGLCSPKMKPYGTPDPLIYVLGEAPGQREDERGRPFVGPSGKLLREYLPEPFQDSVRYNNVTRCFPGKGDTPDPAEIEACRPSIVRDIEACKPIAIFGFGNVPLNWAVGESGITKWSGRRVPVKIGSHVCWYFPFTHPAYVLRNRPEYSFGPYPSEDDFAFAFQLKQACKQLDRLPTPKVHSEQEAMRNLEIITGAPGDLERVDALFAELMREPYIGFDYETNAIRPYANGAKLLSVAFAGPKRSVAIALRHQRAKWRNADVRKLYMMIRKFLLANRKSRFVSHQLPFEIEWSAFWFGEDVIWGTTWGDTASQAYILDERPWTLALDFLVKNYFGLSIKALHNLDKYHLDDAPLETVLRYNALDAKYHRLVYLKQQPILEAANLQEVYAHQLQRTIAVVPTQLTGVPIDSKVNQEMRARYEANRAEIEKEIADHPQHQVYRSRTGQSFRPSALDDVRRYLVLVLGRDEFRKTKFGELSLKESTLRQINDPIIKLVLHWRKCNKVLSTYILPVGEDSEHVYADGYMHPIISTTKTRTWRTSSEDPNTQNWPARDPVAMEARKQVKPGANERVVAFDFAGIQARNVAMESKDPRLVKYFHERYDIHADWMRRLAKLDPNWVDGGLAALERDKALYKRHRYLAKNKFVFPSFFGAHFKSVSRELGVDIRTGERLQRMFWAEFPSIKKWQEGLVKFYYRHGYVTGLSGFRRRAPIIRNELINSPIQSDESIIVCDAMVRIHRLGLPCTMEIHDDLTFIWPKDKIDEYAEIVIGEMLKISFPWINVPLQVAMSVGLDWGTLSSAGEYESVGLTNGWREVPKE